MSWLLMPTGIHAHSPGCEGQGVPPACRHRRLGGRADEVAADAQDPADRGHGAREHAHDPADAQGCLLSAPFFDGFHMAAIFFLE